MQFKFWKKQEPQIQDETIKANYIGILASILNQRQLLPFEIDVTNELIDGYIKTWVVKNDGVSLDSQELNKLVYIIASTSVDDDSRSAIINFVRDKYYPSSARIH